MLQAAGKEGRGMQAVMKEGTKAGQLEGKWAKNAGRQAHDSVQRSTRSTRAGKLNAQEILGWRANSANRQKELQSITRRTAAMMGGENAACNNGNWLPTRNYY
eukprot:3447734-Alexandrium_andersonii.AAC.1